MSELQQPAPVSITRRFQFCAGHRVHGHESKCRHLHGHNYIAHVTVSAPQLDALGRVIDFGVVKAIVGAWIDSQWDHAFLVANDDDEALHALDLVRGQRMYFMANPTAENMALELLKQAQLELARCGHESLRVLCVELEETENCRARAWA